MREQDITSPNVVALRMLASGHLNHGNELTHVFKASESRIQVSIPAYRTSGILGGSFIHNPVGRGCGITV